MHLLYIESSPRGPRSVSIAVADAFLQAYRQACPELTVDTLNVWEENLPEFDQEAIGAKLRGLRTVNIVRRQELVDELKAIGGDVVVVDSPDVAARIREAVGQDDLHLALDGVSGPATGVLASTLSPGGTLVSFAAMSEAPMSMSPLDVIFKPITMRGFWMGHPEYAAKIPPALKQAAAMIASGLVHAPVAAVYPLSSIKEAVAHAQRGGKVLLDVAGSPA